MASQCPKCHQVLDEDYVCCAGTEFQWRCQSCLKRSRGFVMPFGQCELCGGELKRVEWETSKMDPRLLTLQEAFQIEINAFHFYHHLAESVDDPETSDFFESMSEMEREHADELNEKYHLHIGEEIFQKRNFPLPEPFFDDLCFFEGSRDVTNLYNCAIELEKRTLKFFFKKAEEIPDDKQRELYLELAAEEREHVALLKSQRDRYE